MRKLGIAILIVAIVVLVIALVIVFLSKTKITNTKPENIVEVANEPTVENKISDEPIVTEPARTGGMEIVPTMNDKITADSSWCGTFQLVWNDMKNEVVKRDIIFNPQLEMVENLNKEDFNETMLSDEYYYKIYGFKSLELKAEIEKGIKEKFNQTSDILNDFDWSDEGLNDPNNLEVNRYFFYTMLYRKFEFLKEFNKLENGDFGKKYNNVKYFGIDENTDDSARNQIDVLYYNSKDDFAILVNTKTDDEVIFCKNPNGSNFNEIYENMNQESNKYTGTKAFKSIDEFKAPNLKFNEKREYKELQDKSFKTENGVATIAKAIQTINLSLDEKGGEIKSEAAIDIETATVVHQPIQEEPRYFYVDDAFAIFLREKGKEKPYFAGRIEDITKFQ